jgi:hypothetical protein
VTVCVCVRVFSERDLNAIAALPMRKAPASGASASMSASSLTLSVSSTSLSTLSSEGASVMTPAPSAVVALVTMWLENLNHPVSARRMAVSIVT